MRERKDVALSWKASERTSAEAGDKRTREERVDEPHRIFVLMNECDYKKRSTSCRRYSYQQKKIRGLCKNSLLKKSKFCKQKLPHDVIVFQLFQLPNKQFFERFVIRIGCVYPLIRSSPWYFRMFFSANRHIYAYFSQVKSHFLHKMFSRVRKWVKQTGRRSQGSSLLRLFCKSKTYKSMLKSG